MEAARPSNRLLMRLRSSQFVFLLLLLCSVQLRDGYTLRTLDGFISDHTGSVRERQEQAAARQRGTSVQAAQALAHTVLISPPASTRQTPWPMPAPARAAAAVQSHTSLRRA